MRFLRILPAVWAMISWPFWRRTRKVALGSNSLTVPSNSSNSSLAIRPQLILRTGAGDCTEAGQNQGVWGIFPPVLGRKTQQKRCNAPSFYPLPTVIAFLSEFRGNLAL